MLINNSLKKSNTSTLSEGFKLLTMLDEKHYNAMFKPAFSSTIGAHYRHILEHYECFFSQLDTYHFCYDLRKRNLQLETDLKYAQAVMSKIILLMKTMDISTESRSYYLSDESINTKIETSLLRELAFLQSHTTHHYAIIAAIARSLGVQPQADFGVAIATRSHQLKSQEMEITKCAH